MGKPAIILLSHPYHRGGVTQWMINVFNFWNENDKDAFMISVRPTRHFISAGNRPTVSSLLNNEFMDNIFLKRVNFIFELGTLQFKAQQYVRLLESLQDHMRGLPLIPSDDEACWMAAAMCSTRFQMVGVLHADDDAYFKLARKYKPFVSAFVCVSSRIERKLLAEHPDLIGRVLTLPCGIEISKFDFRNAKENVIVWIGRLSTQQKRAQDILPIFRKVREVNHTCQLMVLGDGDYYEQLKVDISRHALGQVVYIPGWVSDQEIRRQLSRSKVFLQTSDYEGTSVAMMEALASGCMVVSSRVSGVEDLEYLAMANQTIKLFEIGDVEGASGAVKEVLSRKNSEVHSFRARQLSEELFDVNINTKLLHNFLMDRKGFIIHEDYRAVRLKQIAISLVLALSRLVKWYIKKNE